jgi:hypothetical protein
MQHPTSLAALPPSPEQRRAWYWRWCRHGEVVIHMEQKFKIFVAKKSSVDAKSTKYL